MAQTYTLALNDFTNSGGDGYPIGDGGGAVLGGAAGQLDLANVVCDEIRDAGTIDPKVISTMQLGTYPSVILPAKLDIVLRLMGDAGTISGAVDGTKLTNLNANS